MADEEERAGSSSSRRPRTGQRSTSQTHLAPPESPGSARMPVTPTRRSPRGSPSPSGRQSFPVLTSSTSNERVPSANRSVRIRRLPSSSSTALRNSQLRDVEEHEEDPETRRRSFSAPQRPVAGSLPPPNLSRQQTDVDIDNTLSTVHEESSHASNPRVQALRALEGSGPQRGPSQRSARQRASSTASRLFSGLNSGGGSRRRADSTASQRSQRSQRSEDSTTVGLTNYDEDIVDVLDVIDPEVSTLNTLNNVQNSLVVPNLGRFLNRRPTYDLSRHTSNIDLRNRPQIIGPLPPRATAPKPTEKPAEEQGPSTKPEKATPIEEAAEEDLYSPAEQVKTDEDLEKKQGIVDEAKLARTQTLKSVLSAIEPGDEHNYAVLPHGVILEGWSEEDKAELNDHVRHLLHSRKERFKRSMRAFGKYIRQPLGFFVTLYAFLITFWGAAWVLFLIGWISVGGRQDYFIEICDQVLTALFCVVGIGLAPFRIVDTYHMIYIVHYHFLTWRLRRQRGLPELRDPNELPEPSAGASAEDIELARQKTIEDVVLTPEQQRKLVHHQTKFSHSHTFYKPHETFTHHAFSVKLLILVVLLLDFHSMFQMALGGTTWGIYYRKRGHIITTVILCFSISCNISAGITISIGDHRSRKKLIVEQIFRQGVTEHALHQMHRERGIDFDRTEEGAKQRMEEKAKEKEKRDWLKPFRRKGNKKGQLQDASALSSSPSPTGEKEKGGDGAPEVYTGT